MDSITEPVVHEAIRCRGSPLPSIGIDLDAQRRRRQPGLRDPLISSVSPLVFGAALDPIASLRRHAARRV